MHADILPNSATAWERAVSEAMDGLGLLSPSIAAIRGTKLVSPLPSFLPFLVYEYGLGELTPFVPNLYDLIYQGVGWQRVRGTPSALAIGLVWIGYTARIEEEDYRRRFWNLFQLELDRVRDQVADLDRIAGIARLSVSKRSAFWRGYHGFDVRPLSFGEGHYGNAHFGEYSGVRLTDGGPLWSFGRRDELDLQLTREHLVALGIWIEERDATVTDFGIDTNAAEEPMVQFLDLAEVNHGLGWDDITWGETEAQWSSSAEQARSESMAAAVVANLRWMAFLDQDDAPIGYRRVRSCAVVEGDPAGPYSVAGIRYRPSEIAGSLVFAACLTGFGDGAGQTARRVALLLGGENTMTSAPGQAWLEPGALEGGGDPVAVFDVDIPFGESIRDSFNLLLRF